MHLQSKVIQIKFHLTTIPKNNFVKGSSIRHLGVNCGPPSVTTFIFCYRMTKDNYEVLVDTAIQSATVLDHSKSPCEENFIPDTQVGNNKNIFFV